MRWMILAFLSMMSLGLAASSQPINKPTSHAHFTLENTLVLRGAVSQESVAKLSTELQNFKGEAVYLFIDSPGGSVFDGLELVNVIAGSKVTVTCVTSQAISMAFVILQACDERLALPSAHIMQHVGSVQIGGKINEVVSFLNHILAVTKEMNQMQASRIGITLKEFEDKIANDWWLTANEALKANVVDEIVTASCSKELTAKIEKVTVPGIFGMSMEIEFSGCPLLSSPLPPPPPKPAPETPGVPA